jgi:Fe-S-cluster containining protein
MRSCGECTKCCELLQGNAYGHEFGCGNSCKFLGTSGCKIYKIRPECCRNYYCAWAQELLPEEMRPDKCGVLVSVENGEKGQYLRVINENEEINSQVFNYLKQWSIFMNAPVIYKKDNSWEVL